MRSGRALYVGISNYKADQVCEAAKIARGLGTPLLIHQPAYNMLNRWVETDLLTTLNEEGLGCIAFSPLAQGVLTDKYLKGIPEGSRASKPHGFLRPEQLTEARLYRVNQLNDLAHARGQTLAQMALAWVLRHPTMTSALIGTSRVEQIEEGVAALVQLNFTAEELQAIETILAES